MTSQNDDDFAFHKRQVLQNNYIYELNLIPVPAYSSFGRLSWFWVHRRGKHNIYSLNDAGKQVYLVWTVTVKLFISLFMYAFRFHLINKSRLTFIYSIVNSNVPAYIWLHLICCALMCQCIHDYIHIIWFSDQNTPWMK